MEPKNIAIMYNRDGTVTIPAHIFNELGWGEGSMLEFTIVRSDVGAVLIKQVMRCCNSCISESTRKFKGNFLCPECVGLAEEEQAKGNTGDGE